MVKNSTSNNKRVKSKGNISLNSKKVKKRSRVEEKQYSFEDIINALDAIGSGLSFRATAAQFGVPTTTLHSKLNHKSPIECKKGPPTILSTVEEEEIAQWLLTCSQKGFPVTSHFCLIVCKDI